MKIKEYCATGFSEINQLNRFVMSMVSVGWQPFGNVYYAEGLHFQPMVKYDINIIARLGNYF